MWKYFSKFINLNVENIMMTQNQLWLVGNCGQIFGSTNKHQLPCVPNILRLRSHSDYKERLMRILGFQMTEYFFSQQHNCDLPKWMNYYR